MIHNYISTTFLRSAWMLWCLLITLALMFIGGVIGTALITLLDQVFPLHLAIVSGFIGGVVGAVVGGFRSLWAQRETAQSLSVRWVGMSALLGMVNMAIFVVLATMMFNLNERVAVLTAIRFGLLYGAIFSTLRGVWEWFVLRRYTISRWQWLSVGWIAWMLWWVSIAYLLSDISGMD